MTIKTADEIFREKEEREKEEAKEKAMKDVKDFIEGVFPKKEKKFSFIKLIGGLFLVLFFATIISGCIWLLKFFLGGIF